MPLRIFHYNFPCRTMKNLKVFSDFYLLTSYLIDVGVILSPIIAVIVN